MDHLGVSEFMVLGFCIGGPFIWNLLEAGRRPRRRGGADAALRVPADNARPVLPEQYQELAPQLSRARGRT